MLGKQLLGSLNRDTMQNHSTKSQCVLVQAANELSWKDHGKKKLIFLSFVSSVERVRMLGSLALRDRGCKDVFLIYDIEI